MVGSYQLCIRFQFLLLTFLDNFMEALVADSSHVVLLNFFFFQSRPYYKVALCTKQVYQASLFSLKTQEQDDAIIFKFRL